MRCAIIPARGGSVRIPHKNIKNFYGKPMIAYPIKTAFRSDLFDVVFVSTEDPDIAKVAKRYGAEIIPRPPELAEINAPDCGTQEVTRHAIEWINANYVNKVSHACCIYPCTPLLTVGDLQLAWSAMLHANIDFAYSVNIEPFRDAGQYYWGTAEAFLNKVPLDPNGARIMKCVVERGFDIDTPEDWIRAEQMYAEMVKA